MVNGRFKAEENNMKKRIERTIPFRIREFKTDEF
jgi:hypothetical protein